MAEEKNNTTSASKKGMATKAGAIALVRGPRFKSYLKAVDELEKAAEHTKAVKASLKAKPDTDGKIARELLKAKAARKAASDKVDAAQKLWKTDPFDPDPDSYYRSDRHYKGGKIKKKNYAPGGRMTSGKSGEEVSDSDLKLLEKRRKDGFFTSVSDLMDRIKKKNYTEKQKNKQSKRESDFLKELQKLRQFQTDKSTKERASGRMIEQIIKELGQTGTIKKILKKKKGGSKIKKNYAKGGGVRPTSY